MNQIQIEISCNGSVIFSSAFEQPVEMGRQREHEPTPPTIVQSEGRPRVIIAPLTELSISRSHLLVEQNDDQRVKVTNLVKHSPISIGGHRTINPGESIEFKLPIEFPLGDRMIKIQSLFADSSIQGMAHPTLPPQTILHQAADVSIADLQSPRGLPPERIIKWVNQILVLFQDVPGTDKFYQRALRNMQQMLNLSTAAVLFCDDENWRTESVVFSNLVHDRDQWRPSRTILECARNEGRAFRKSPQSDSDSSASLIGVSSLVAAPILSADGKVIGALYGDRKAFPGTAESEISEIETLFVELIASGISAGLARVEQEQKAFQARTRFEQFFPPSLARRLEDDEHFLKGRDCDVTVLFCDIRGFSSIAEKIGPEQTVQWINGVMNELSDCVLQHEGVLVDYIGDELMAMWGAPDVQTNHALLACRAALDMLDRLPKLTDEWSERIGGPVLVGIGLNSGPAQVGNIGSSIKFKYGPLGNSVNIASRLQSATKQVGTRALISKSTADATGGELDLRRLCQIQVVNVSEPLTVYELASRDTPLWGELRELYEAGLDAFENADFLGACRQLTDLLTRFPGDGPAQILLSRAVEGMQHKDSPNTGVWQLERK